jgi:carboxymethylenebutenolidase
MFTAAPAVAQTPAAAAASGQPDLRYQPWAAKKLVRSPNLHQWVEVRVGDRILRAFVTSPKVSSKLGIVLVLHEVFGLTDSTLLTADAIASMGYIAIAPDMLSGLGPRGEGSGTFSDSRSAGELMTVLPDTTINAALNGLTAYASALPRSNGKLAIVGLSWGGGAAFRYAASSERRSGLNAVCVFYDVGPPTETQGPNRDSKGLPPIALRALNVPVHGFYPSNDVRVMNSLPATRAAMAAYGKAFDPIVYQGADHAFMRLGEDPTNHNIANNDAETASLARLKDILAHM